MIGPHNVGRFQPQAFARAIAGRDEHGPPVIAANPHFVGRFRPDAFKRFPYNSRDTSEASVSPVYPVNLESLIFSGVFFDCDLYTITLASGDVVRLSTADFPVNAVVTVGGVQQSAAVYPTSPMIDQKESKTQAHWKVGLDTDQWVVVVMPRPFDLATGALFPDTIGGVPWLQGAMGGLLDAADFQVDRAYFSVVPTWPMPPGGAVPVGTVTIFAGVVAEVDTTNLVAVIQSNDYRSLLAFSMPRHFYQGQCRHTLFDAGCSLSAAAFAVTGSAQAGSTQQNIVCPGLPPPANSSGTFALGVIRFTGGQNAGFSATVSNWDGANFSLVTQLPFPVAVGDTFTVGPGCNKTLAACNLFNNQISFGGQPDIPAPEALTG